MTEVFASRMARVKPSAIRELLQMAADPGILPFGGGYPDPALFPLEGFEHVRQSYRRKKQVMLDAMRASFPREVSFTDPEGGMFTWITFPAGFDSEQFLRRFALPEAKVAYVPGATFFPCVEETITHGCPLSRTPMSGFWREPAHSGPS